MAKCSPNIGAPAKSFRSFRLLFYLIFLLTYYYYYYNTKLLEMLGLAIKTNHIALLWFGYEWPIRCVPTVANGQLLLHCHQLKRQPCLPLTLKPLKGNNILVHRDRSGARLANDDRAYSCSFLPRKFTEPNCMCRHLCIKYVMWCVLHLRGTDRKPLFWCDFAIVTNKPTDGD